MAFADLHMHLLCNVDDGADSEEKMYGMLDASYKDGSRIICATPHYHPGYYGDNKAASLNAFEKLKEYASKYTDLRLFLGNELYFSPSCFDWLSKNECRTLNESRYLLVDFSEREEAGYIVDSTLSILNFGYIPVLAHAERYESFDSNLKEVYKLKECGVLIQVDAQSPFGDLGRGAKKKGKRILKEHLADLVGSDAHDIVSRPPVMSACYDYVLSKCGKEYADEIFYANALKILEDKDF